MKQSFLLFVRNFYKNNKKAVTLLTAGSLFWAFTFPIAPLLLGLIIDQLKEIVSSTTQNYTSVIVSGLAFFLVQFLRNCNYYLITKNYTEGLANSQSLAVTQLFSYLCHKPLDYFDQQASGALSGKVNNVLTGLDPIITSFFIIIMPQIIAVTLAGIIMSFITPWLSLLFWIWAGSVIYLTYKSSKLSHYYATSYAHSQSELSANLTDTLMNIQTVLTHSTQAQEQERLKQSTESMSQQYIKLRMFLERARFKQGLCTDLFVLATMITLLYGFWLGTVSLGDFAFVFSLTFNISGVFFNLGSTIAEFHKNLGKVQDGYSLIDRVEPKTVKKSLNKLEGSGINFKDVSFHYHAHSPVIRHLSLEIAPTEKVGIVGLSGAGKSTLLKLLLRLYQPSTGQILIGNTDIQTVDIETLHAHLAFVPQDLRLFNRTLKENITYGCGEKSQEAIEKACYQANCLSFIKALPNQFDTIVGEQGTRLSGGQRQRIAIAKAILKDAPILLLDEATSALDSETEASIQQALDSLIRDKTAVVIAHRLSTLKQMDRIIVLQDGQVVEVGTHQALLKRKGIFYSLWQQQSEGFF
ncbi:ABC transporter ATP-binding protein [Legionella clemsonensis]|uniref:Lipid A export ATP-binding/permease protein MsbA n=1 Tax=Legionella clemsonensis TaxID=1867846 RepID=A0A222P5L8_9GAMM|nr:ABC transporter ATP-binding protein [Legionella clemsonensis]ASQ47146.1 Lipid A export ATP-binding/permease protein MsbA [Legionella clemsonensis]